MKICARDQIYRIFRLTLICAAITSMAYVMSVDAAVPNVSNIRLSTDKIGCYDMVEISADIDTQATNYYWPYDADPPASIAPGAGVTVVGLFTRNGSSTTLEVPAFYYQQYDRHRIDSLPATDVNCELYTPVGSPCWRIRFAPEEVGTWRFKIKVNDSGGEYTSGESVFECVEGTSKGFIRVSPTDPEYFETSSGETVFGPGINGHLRSSYYADDILAKCGDNGVKTVRFWMTSMEYNHVFGGMGQNWGNVTLAYSPNSRSNKLFCAKISAGSFSYQNVYLTAGQTYKVTGYVKTDSLVGGGLNVWVGNINGYSTSPSITSGTTDWKKISFSYTATATGVVALWLRNMATSGTAYFDAFSMTPASGDGDLISKGDFDTQNYMDQIESAEVDYIFQTAKDDGVHLKTVVTEKWDDVLSRIGPDGAIAARAVDNTYAPSDNYPCRWLQKAWWRYMTARWGAYTSLHSWEWCNEGDVNNGNHWNAAIAMADYVHSIYPRRILCTTSFYQGPVQAELWKEPSLDYIDSHDYICTNLPGMGYYTRIYAPMDLVQGTAYNKIELPWTSTQGTVDYDYSIKHSGSRSLRGITALVSGPANWLWVMPRYHIGIDPSHSYTIKYWVKADDVAVDPEASWFKGGCTISWSKSFHENDYVSPDANVMPSSVDTYDWMQVTKTGIAPPATANTANIYFRCPANTGHNASMWIDDVEFIDETTGKNLIVGGGFEEDRMDYDIALGVEKFGVFYKSYSDRLKKPTICGETGISTWNLYGTPYKGYNFTDESQALVDDTDGIHIKDFVWAHVGPYNPNMLYWWTDLLATGDGGQGFWHYFGAFSRFMDNAQLSNGRYKDVDATVSGSGLRVLGQKDVIDGTAYMWIANKAYTWKAAVDHNTSPVVWNASTTYSITSTCVSADGLSIYRSLKNSNVNHALSDTDWWVLVGAKPAARALPSAVSESVEIGGFPNGKYVEQLWDTSSGTVITTKDAQYSNGKITIDIANLLSDVACKIFLKPAVVDMQITVPSAEVIPGQSVTITVSFTNSGASTAYNIKVSARVPAEMDYVSGSAEESGGVYDSATNSVSWTISSLDAGGTGTRTFRTKVR